MTLYSLKIKIQANNHVKGYLVCLSIFVSIFTSAQSVNYRAQGNYYSAKSKYKAGLYYESIDYINKSKTALGGTNEELQYLHILASYRLEDFESAQKELQTFFDIGDKKVNPVYFDKTVDRLTNDETKELTMLMDPIFEAADRKKNHRCKTCTGTGKMTKTVYKDNACHECADSDYGAYLVSYTDGSRWARKGYQTKEMRGHTKRQCTACNGKGMGICSKCNGLGTSKCKGCANHPTNPSGLIGFTFDCIPCSGNGYMFDRCTNCNGTKNYKTSSTVKVSCIDCNGKGY